jgi:hypothetical protein
MEDVSWLQFTLKFSMNAILCVRVVPNYVNFATISNIHYPFLCCAFTLHAALEIWTYKMTVFSVQSCDGNPPQLYSLSVTTTGR